jgi:hypothetical protein
VSRDDRGVVAVEATGADRRAALEAGLRAVLALVLEDAGNVTDDFTRVVPLRGEGDDLAALFADLLADLCALLEEHGGALREVSIDGVLRRDRGGFVAWGYVSLGDDQSSAVTLPRLHGTAIVLGDQTSGFTIRALLSLNS